MKSRFHRAAFLALVAAAAVVGGMPHLSEAESPAEAIARIRHGSHVQMPSPRMERASGPAGKGMTIENGTGSLLRVHFSGPTNRSVEVAGGRAAGVELVVGRYEVAVEMPGTPIIPLYGKQMYRPNTHYWLKFFVEKRAAGKRPIPLSRSTPGGTSPPGSARGRPPGGA